MNIIELAKQAGFASRGEPPAYWNCLPNELEHFAALVRAAALEEAAGLCENPDLIMNSTFDGVAAAIRNLKEKT
jgi:hypothetical protein